MLPLPSATTYQERKRLINTTVTGYGTLLTEHASHMGHHYSVQKLIILSTSQNTEDEDIHNFYQWFCIILKHISFLERRT
jgi:hypothetical protein